MAVPDVQASFTAAVRAGADPVSGPTTQHGLSLAAISGFGDVSYRFVARHGPRTLLVPGLVTATGTPPGSRGMLTGIDHIAVCLPPGSLGSTVRSCQDVLGLAQTFTEHIIVGTQAMNSIVVQNPGREVTFTLLEPDTTRSRGQIDDFLDTHGGPGVQHIALRTPDIIAAIRSCAGRGVRFLATPASYYDKLPDRLGPGLPLASLRELSILADKDRWGLMFQIFTETVHPRRTFFYELIERRGALTFGSSNARALYEAVEQQHTMGTARSGRSIPELT